MTDKEIIFTHRGWFLFCPVYAAFEKGDCNLLVSPNERISPRLKLFKFLLNISVWLLQALFYFITVFNKSYDPQWPIFITGELKKNLQA